MKARDTWRDQKPGANGSDTERDKIVRQEKYRHEARSEIAQDEARAAMTLPETPSDRSLDERLRDSPEPVPYHIEGLARRRHNVVVAAQYKTGKTSLAVERVRAEVDGLPFLDSFATRRIDGNVGFWNNELEPADIDDYFREVAIANRAKVFVEDCKGFRVPLLNDFGAEFTIKWLNEREIESWYLDPWRAVCSWSRVNEYLDPEVAPLVEQIDAIKRETGVLSVHINHHCGARDLTRPRGATTLADWADAIWMYARESERRYLSAIGRGVDLAEGIVELDEDRRLLFKEGGRREQTAVEAREELVAYVEEHPGCKTGDATAAITYGGAKPTTRRRRGASKAFRPLLGHGER